jgi:hypothetical protein
MYAPSLADYISPVDFSSVPPQNLPNGYLISSDAEANKYLFLYSNNYDPAILTLAENTKHPVTVSELLSLTGAPMMNQYGGLVIVVNGGMLSCESCESRSLIILDADLPYCGSNCTATGGVAPSIGDMVKMSFPNVAAANFSSYNQPSTGHGFNLHYNSTAAYKRWLDFLGTKNLMTT